MTATFVTDDQEIRIPSWVVDLTSFRKWGRSDEFPVEGRICFLGEIWIDTSMEQLFSHNQVKNEISFALNLINKREKSGMFFPDGASLVNVAADLCSIPDGIFVKAESFENNSVVLCEGAREGFVELEGSPDMVLEIVSDSSVRKDKTDLLKRYAKAGITEYWVVDARKPPLEFTIYRLGKDGYEAVEVSDDGWIASCVFGESFRLSQTEGPAGHPEFSLETK